MIFGQRLNNDIQQTTIFFLISLSNRKYIQLTGKYAKYIQYLKEEIELMLKIAGV